MLAPDFFTTGLLHGTKACVLAAMEHGTCRIRVPGATQNPARSRVAQQARNLLTDLEDTGMRVKSVLHDRDASFTAASGAVSRAAGARAARPAIPGTANELDHGTLDRQLPA
jgi:putative transposase